MGDIKILATLGPSSLKHEVITGMAAAGVYLFRINLSHTRLEELEDVIEFIRGCTDVPICIDSEGAQIRTRRLLDGTISLVQDSQVQLHFDDTESDPGNLSFYPDGIVRNFEVGDLIDIDFHGAQLRVSGQSEKFLESVVEKGGRIGANKAVTVNRPISLPAMTEKDRRAVDIARRLDVRHFALSFANSTEDVANFRSCIGGDAFLITKIESIKGVRNLIEIADMADALLIDRGDLSREVPIVKIPFLQRRIVSSVKSRDKPIYVATNFLESMIEWHQPNRAEVNDVISTLEMGATGLILAAETAIGGHPIASVRTIRRLIENFERWTPNTSFEELLSAN